MATWISPGEAAGRFRKLADLQRRELVNGARRATHVWRKRAFGLFAQRGIGRVFGETAVLGRIETTAQARVIIKRERVTVKGELIETGLRLRGFAALVEGGGTTKPHEIKPKNAEILAWPSVDGMNFARRVSHPGGRIPRNPFTADAGRLSQPDFVREMDKATRKAAELAGLV